MHAVTHKKHAQFECDSCGRQFLYKRNLYSHIMRHCQNTGLDENNENNNDVGSSSSSSTSNNGDLIKKLLTGRNRYFCKECNRCFVYENAALNCKHKISLRNDINNRLNCVNTDNDKQKRLKEDDRMKVKISLVTENQSNQIVPLYELNIPAVDSTSTTTDITNPKSNGPLDSEHRNIEPIILVQAFTTPFNSTTTKTTSTRENSIKRNISVEVSNRVDLFEAFCDSLAPEIIVIDDSSDEETIPRNANETTVGQAHSVGSF